MNKVVLGCCSPQLLALLTGARAASPGQANPLILLRGISARDMHLILQFVYTGQGETFFGTTNNLYRLLYLSVLVCMLGIPAHLFLKIISPNFFSYQYLVSMSSDFIITTDDGKVSSLFLETIVTISFP